MISTRFVLGVFFGEKKKKKLSYVFRGVFFQERWNG
jgi:hypothetical protein